MFLLSTMLWILFVILSTLYGALIQMTEPSYISFGLALLHDMHRTQFGSL